MSGQDLVHGEDVQIEDVIYIIKDIQQFVHKIGQRTIIQVALEKDIRKVEIITRRALTSSYIRVDQVCDTSR